jgi:signal transduction histidine kinase
MTAFTQTSTFDHVAELLKTSHTFYLVLVDNRGHYAYINEYFLEKYADFYKDRAERPANAALHPDDHQVAYDASVYCVQNPHECHQATLRKLNGRGGYIITQWDFKANLLADGTVSGVIGVGYDITDFETRQDHIKFLSSTLRDVAYKQSHLIRRPLANIIGLADMLENSDIDESAKVIVKLLKQSCHELNLEFDSFLVKDDVIIDNGQPQ